MNDPFDKLDQPETSADKATRQRRAVEMVRRFMKKSDEYRRPFLLQAERARELYTVWDLQAKTLTQRANLKLPYAYLIVQSEIPDIVGSLLKDRLPFKVRGRKGQDMQFEDALNDFHSQQLDAMRFSPKFVEFVTALLIDGTAIAKLPYKYREQVVTVRQTVTDPFTGIAYPTKRQELQVMFDGPDCELVPLQDFFPDWSTRSPGNIEGMRGCVHRTTKTFQELEDAGFYSNLDELRHSTEKKGVDAWGDPYYKTERSAPNNEDHKRKPIEVWEYWGLWDPKGNGQYEEYILTVANGDVLIREVENFYDFKFKPFAASVNVVQDGEFYGISELWAVRGLIKEATALRNARLDQVNLAVNRMYVVDRTSGINAKSLYSRPNGIVYTNDMNGIRELPPPEVPASAFNEIQALNNEIQSTSGNNAGPALSEAGRVFGRSATGASIVSNIAASRAGIKARLISDIFLYRVCDIMLATNAQFVSDDVWIKASDPNAPNPFVQLPREAFHCEYDFERVTSLDADPASQMQNLQQFIQFAQVAEQTQPGTVKWDVVFQAVGRDLLGRSVKRFVRTDQERQQLQFQQLAMEQAANAQAGLAAPQPNAPGGAGVKV